MAALAHSEQQQVVQRLKGSVRNYEALKSTRTAELKVQAVAELLQTSTECLGSTRFRLSFALPDTGRYRT
jgi:hypothetical protein